MENTMYAPTSNRNAAELLAIIQRNNDTYLKRLLEYAVALEKAMKKVSK